MDQYIDLARRLRRRFPRSLHSISVQGIAGALCRMAEQGVDVVAIERGLDQRDQREFPTRSSRRPSAPIARRRPFVLCGRSTIEIAGA